VKNIRFIQIGAGRFGQSWLQVLKEYPDAELAAVVDVVPENLENAKQSAGLSDRAVFRDLDEAFSRVDADAVLIVTPPQTHKELALKALHAGYHVLMEKPLTHTYEEAVELLSASRGLDRQIAVSQNYRWRKPVQTVKRLLERNAVGRIGYIEYAFRKAMRFGGWRDAYSDILLEDMSIHHFDMIRYFTGKEAVSVYSESFRPEWSWFSGNPSAGVWMELQDDIRVHYFGSWVSRGKETTWNGDIRIVGDQGAIELNDDQVHVWSGDPQLGAEHRLEPTMALNYEDRTASLDDFVQAIGLNRRPVTSIEDNFRSFELTCATIESARSGQKVSLEQFRMRK
jgi:predicted dehydrogenase